MPKLKNCLYLGQGRHRQVYPKIRLQDGINANVSEAYIYKKYGKNYPFPLARCRLWKGILIMEYIKEAAGPLPDWVLSVDCSQVGYTKKGKLVAYDYATY